MMYEIYQNRWGGVCASRDIYILDCARYESANIQHRLHSCMKVKTGVLYSCPDDSVFAASGNSWTLEAGMLLVFRESLLPR